MTAAWDGRPENPDRDGWHWVVAADPAISTESAPWWWNASQQHWLPPCDVNGALPLSPSRVQWRYLGPCLTPAEVAAQVEAARCVCCPMPSSAPSPLAATLAGLRDGSLVAVSLKLLTEAHACMRACGWQLAPGTETDGDGVLQMAVAEIEDQFGCMLAASEAPRDE